MAKRKRALVTGATGQCGSYLIELLLNKGYEVYGIKRRSSTFGTERLNDIYKDPHDAKNHLHLIYGDLSDASTIAKIIKTVRPQEIYNLAAQSHVRVSFDIPEYTADITGTGVVRVLEAIRNINPKIKFLQISSSEMFGKVQETPQNENTPFYPMSPYGCAKVYGYWITRNYRESYNMFASNVIMFNTESPRRGKTFVTKKITMAASRISLGMQKVLYLGNLDAKRDWSFAADSTFGMWRILQEDTPDDYVLATGETHTVREFLIEAFKHVGIKIKSNKKKGAEEEYIRTDTGETVVKIDSRYYRPAEVDILLGDASKAKKKLGWEPTVKFKELVKMMMEHDYIEAKEENILREHKKNEEN